MTTVQQRRSPLGWWVLPAFLAASALVAWLGTTFTIDNVSGWYVEAQKPAWTPPNWLFGPVWTVLYAAMAVAGWLVWRAKGEARQSALTLYWLQLGLNAAWTPFFFAGFPLWGTSALWVGLVIILALDVVVIATILRFWKVTRAAAYLLLPYLAWILYATTLNAGLAILN